MHSSRKPSSSSSGSRRGPSSSSRSHYDDRDDAPSSRRHHGDDDSYARYRGSPQDTRVSRHHSSEDYETGYADSRRSGHADRDSGRNDRYSDRDSGRSDDRPRSNYHSQNSNEDRPAFNRDYTPDGICKHKMITKQLIVATLLTEYKDLESCPYKDVTIKYHCNTCKRDVYFNTMALGVCYQSGLLFVDFKKSKPRFERKKVLDYTSTRIPKEFLDSCLKLLRGERPSESDSNAESKDSS